MILKLEELIEILKEVISGRRYYSVIHVVINKKLLSDTLNQSKRSNAVVSTDTSNCSDRVIHLIVGLIYQYFSLLIDYIKIFF